MHPALGLKCPSCGILMTHWEYNHHDCERDEPEMIIRASIPKPKENEDERD